VEAALFVTPQGPIFGREAIERPFEGMFQQGHYSNHLNKDDQGSPHMIGTFRELLAYAPEIG
jgi:hypothetical protein